MKINENKASENDIKLNVFFFTEVWLFFLNKYFLNCCKLLITFQNYEIVNSDNFPSVYLAFM